MTTEDTWVLDWFAKLGPVPGKTTEEQLAVNYLAAGLIDSLGIVRLVDEIEAHFGIAFSQEHFQDRNFATIGGLQKIVAALSAAKPG